MRVPGRIRGSHPSAAQELATYTALERPRPSDYLLYPQKRTGPSARWKREVAGVIWEDRSKPLSSTAMHRWWYRCLENAGVVEQGVAADSPMHESRRRPRGVSAYVRDPLGTHESSVGVVVEGHSRTLAQARVLSPTTE